MPTAMPASAPRFEDVHWSSADGVELHARDYRAAGTGGVPILCLPGLTRNARDFEPLAARLAGRHRLIAVDLRGRGESGHARSAASYAPPVYVEDVAALLGHLGIARFAAIGTSLGGIVTMLLAAALPGRLAGALLNDIGPVIEAAGLQRIRGYVGRSSSEPTWMHAARCLAAGHGAIYPDWRIGDWLAMAKRLYRVNANGRLVLDYDPCIAEPFRAAADAPADLWAPFAALAPVPVLVVRGERSDILSAATAAAMAARLPTAQLVTVSRVGHAPLLDEVALHAPIDRWLARMEEPPRR